MELQLTSMLTVQKSQSHLRQSAVLKRMEEERSSCSSDCRQPPTLSDESTIVRSPSLLSRDILAYDTAEQTAKLTLLERRGDRRHTRRHDLSDRAQESRPTELHRSLLAPACTANSCDSPGAGSYCTNRKIKHRNPGSLETRMERSAADVVKAIQKQKDPSASRHHRRGIE